MKIHCVDTQRWLVGRADGIDLADPTIIRRTKNCAEIFDCLGEQPLRLLRSPPASGKTSLAALLANNAPSNRKVISFSALEAAGQPFENLWAKLTGVSMTDALDHRRGPLRTYVIDEAQILYTLGPDSPFWQLLKVINGATTSFVQVLLLAVYGLRARRDQLATPLEFSAVPWSLSFLALSDAEVAEFFAAFNISCSMHGCPPIPTSLQDTMQRVCGRHVGLLRRCVLLFQDHFKGKEGVNSEDEGDFNTGSLMMLGSAGELRALPSLVDLCTIEAEIILRVASAGSQGLTLTDTVILIFPASLVTAGVVDLEPQHSGMVVRFSSPAMHAHALRVVFGNRPRLSLPPNAFLSASSLVRAIVVHMMHSELCDSLSKAAFGSLFERQYQMSFFA